MAAPGLTTVAHIDTNVRRPKPSEFGTNALGFTIPFVVFGIFRYLDLVYRQEKGDRPEKILLTDMPLMVDIGLYVVTAVAILKLTAG